MSGCVSAKLDATSLAVEVHMLRKNLKSSPSDFLHLDHSISFEPIH